VYQVGKVTKYSQMMHGQPSIKITLIVAMKDRSIVMMQHLTIICPK